MNPRIEKAAIIAGFAALVILAVAGWARKPSPAEAYNPAASYTPAATDPVSTPEAAAPPDSAQQVRYDQYGAPCAPVQPAATPAFATRSGVRTARPAPAPQYQQASAVRQPVRTVRRGRSFKKSAAIVAGTAGFGAAMGALAGGGKGAGIGALAGGGAGFLYDRLTHNR